MGMEQEEYTEMAMPGEFHSAEVLKLFSSFRKKVHGRSRTHLAWTTNAICSLERLRRDGEEILRCRPATLVVQHNEWYRCMGGRIIL